MTLDEAREILARFTFGSPGNEVPVLSVNPNTYPDYFDLLVTIAEPGAIHMLSEREVKALRMYVAQWVVPDAADEAVPGIPSD